MTKGSHMNTQAIARGLEIILSRAGGRMSLTHIYRRFPYLFHPERSVKQHGLEGAIRRVLQQHDPDSEWFDPKTPTRFRRVGRGFWELR